MKISTRSRYGLRLMIRLGMHYGEGPVFLKDIAKEEGISEKYLSQIIIPLRVSGLVYSYRGAYGGYVLARDPTDINVRQVVEALEGSLQIVDCVGNADDCKRISVCVTRQVWADLGESISEFLERTTLDVLIGQARTRVQADDITYYI